MTFLLAANWKMNLGREASVSLCRELADLTPNLKKSEIWLAPSFTNIEAVRHASEGSSIAVGAQNAHWAESGAFTGEISCAMLKECGADFAIIGHSERRHIFRESDDSILQRSVAVLKSGLKLIFCIGETLKDREAGNTEKIISEQLFGIPNLCRNYKPENIILAYEPVWAIGTGKVATVTEITSVHDFIESEWEKLSDSSCPRILYGGSVNADNILSISAIKNVSGALVGGASNTFKSFSEIINALEV